MKDITVLAYYDRLSLFHSLKPLLFSKHRKRFKYTNDPNYILDRDTNSVLLIFRWFVKPDVVDLEFMKKVRAKYKRVAFFNGNAGGSIIRPEILPYVDFFYSKALFKDRTLYKKKFYGDEMFSDYYHRKYGVVDEQPLDRQIVEDDTQLDKLRLFWNIGVTDFPNTKLRQRVGVILARLFGPNSMRFLYHRNFWKGAGSTGLEKKYNVHGRLGFPAKKSIQHQRNLIVDIIKDNPDFLSGRVEQKQFNKEIKASKIILSPFGWGELCKRDFEAVYMRSLLLKPDMSHLETWPDIFIPGKTYVPFKWDLSDLEEKANYYLNHDKEREEIIDNAFNKYKEQLAELDERFDAILKEIME